jgi:hypothetical protein
VDNVFGAHLQQNRATGGDVELVGGDQALAVVVLVFPPPLVTDDLHLQGILRLTGLVEDHRDGDERDSGQ